MGIQERKKREKEGRRKQILSASKQLFAERGFHQTTMEEIANAAELSPGTIYLYFKSKDELFAELSLLVIQYLNSRLEKLAAGTHNTAAENLAGIKDILQDICTFDAFMLVNALKLQSADTLRKISKELLVEIRKETGRAAAHFYNFFNEGIRSGELIEKRPEVMTGTLWGFFSGMVLLNEIQESFTPHGADGLPQALENAFEIFSRGISKTPPQSC